MLAVTEIQSISISSVPSLIDTSQVVDFRMNARLTNAVLAFYFITWGTDASEGSLQILTGPRRTRARKGNALISIFREKEEKK